jgi:proteasome assembly chaperone (PAC2) family protein
MSALERRAKKTELMLERIRREIERRERKEKRAEEKEAWYIG